MEIITLAALGVLIVLVLALLLMAIAPLAIRRLVKWRLGVG